MAGKYDKQCAALCDELGAESVFLIVQNGVNGSGASSCYLASTTQAKTMRYDAAALEVLAADLRRKADKIDGRDLAH